ncbi:MAG: PilZ domain-containing protein [Methylococcaceae bacterium]|nr:PilZ domain-containing protein [Methylococcaceae bacterium]MDP3904482.1 PilZ domain-containing protein [Methylococcaceae bacterium]
MEITVEARRHLRLAHRAKIQLCSKDEVVIAYTRDLSESGLYVLGGFNSAPLPGDILEVIVLGIEDALPRRVVVIRVDDGSGFAVEFLE